MLKLYKITNSAHHVGRWAAEKCLQGVCPLEVFLVYTIPSQMVLSQSTQPIKPVGFLVRVAKPLAISGATPKSKSYLRSFLPHWHLWWVLQRRCQVLYFTEKILGENLVQGASVGSFVRGHRPSFAPLCTLIISQVFRLVKSFLDFFYTADQMM